MDIKISAKDVKYIKVRAGVRYWEDSEYNGKDDVSLCDAKEPIAPRMPFAVPTGEETSIAPQGAYDWVIKIDVESGKVIGWREGDTANIMYKTCDDNTISLYDKDGKLLGEYECYVPNFLCIGDDGYGDYIELVIEGNGRIKDFKFTDADIYGLENNCF